MRVVESDEYFELGDQAVIDEARRVAGDGPTYISFDMDAFDAVYVPGTGAPGIGGYSPGDAPMAANLSFEPLDAIAESVVARRE